MKRTRYGFLRQISQLQFFSNAMIGDLSAVPELPRRSSDLPRAAVHSAGVVRLLNSDTTWAENLVERIYIIDPEAEACWVREHTLDAHIDLHIPDKVTALRAARELLEDLTKVTTDEKGLVHLSDTTSSFAVLVRRALMTRVRVLAVTEVTIEENTSGTIDEIVAHRLGQLAIVGSEEEATGIIEVEGRTVLGSDIHFENENVSVSKMDQGVELVHMRQGERFSALVTASQGSALEHAKFSAVAAVPFWAQHVLSKAPTAKVRDALVTAGFSLTPGLIVQRRDGLPVRKERLLEATKSAGELQFCPVNSFSLVVESLGQLEPAACLRAAMQAVSTEIEDFCSLLRTDQ